MIKFTKMKKTFRRGERGNVLFLILIAVALFAALSYAVTSSSRSGGGDANSETNLISSAQITQYPATIRTSIIRMVVSNNVQPEDLEFNRPEEFDDIDTVTHGVFHPSGGNATYSNAPEDIMNTGTGNTNAAGRWYFNAENEIVYVGGTTSDGSADGAPDRSTADIIAFLPDIKESVCSRINEELGITGIPTETNIEIEGHVMGTDSSATTTGICDTSCAGDAIGAVAADLNGQPFGCFQMPAGTYHYYHVLVER